MFDKEFSKNLPSLSLHDQTIPIKDGKKQPFGALYDMTQEELKARQEYITDYMKTGFIQAISSPASTAVRFVKKEDG
jgi:hypothetical protein